MSDRLEDINVPPRLLSAIRNEVRQTCEQQLNDIWMVVHSLKDSAGSLSGGASSQHSISSAELEQLRETISGVQKAFKELNEQQSQLRKSIDQLAQDNSQVRKSVEAMGPEIDKKLRGMRKKVQQISGEFPAVPAGLGEKLETIDSMRIRAEKTERDLAQIGGAAALLETRLYDLENRLMRRMEAAENRFIPTGQLGSSPAADQLSDEALISQSTSVNFLVDDLLKVVLKYEGSDLFLKSNALPYTSLSGELVPIGKQVLNTEDCRRLILLALTVSKRKELLERRTVHQLACWHDTVFRITAYFERDRISASIQRVATNIPSIEDLGLPRAMEVLSLEDNGIILVVSPPHSSRHETLISMLQNINRNRKVRLFSLEEKIHYELADAEALVTQQEIGTDVSDLASGLAGLKMLQPDGVMVSNVQDAAAVSQLLELANSHCLVLVGMESTRSIDALETFIGLVPPDRRSWALEVLGRQLRAVLAQHSAPRADGQGSVLVTELLLNNEETNEFIREGHLRLLEPLMDRGVAGMHTLKMSARRLSDAGVIRASASSGASLHETGLGAERNKPALGAGLRRDRPLGEAPRLEPPPMEEPVQSIPRYSLAPPPVQVGPPTPLAAPVQGRPLPDSSPQGRGGEITGIRGDTPGIEGRRSEQPGGALPAAVPQPAATSPAVAPTESGDDTLMGWL